MVKTIEDLDKQAIHTSSCLLKQQGISSLSFGDKVVP